MKMSNDFFKQDSKNKAGLIVGQTGSGKTYLIGEMIADIIKNNKGQVIVYTPNSRYKIDNLSEELGEKVRFEHNLPDSGEIMNSLSPDTWVFCDEFGAKGYDYVGVNNLIARAKEEGSSIILTTQYFTCVPRDLVPQLDYVYIIRVHENDVDTISEELGIDKKTLQDGHKFISLK